MEFISFNSVDDAISSAIFLFNFDFYIYILIFKWIVKLVTSKNLKVSKIYFMAIINNLQISVRGTPDLQQKWLESKSNVILLYLSNISLLSAKTILQTKLVLYLLLYLYREFLNF